MYSYMNTDFDAIFAMYIIVIFGSIAIYFLSHLIIKAVMRWQDGR